jgi:antitoxin (DNA-binding transcriptional repressor) of toxin-antitoxin stability system
MTIDDYHVTMKGIGVAALKAQLSEHLRAVRGGASVVVMDRDVPIARIVPYDEAPDVRPARRPVRDLRVPARPRRATDSAAALLDDRRRR